LIAQGSLFVIAIDNTDLNLASTIYKFTPGGVQSTFGTLPFQSFGLAFDSVGDLFAACAGIPDVANSAAIYKFTPDGTRSVFVGQIAFGDFNGPIGLAFDRFGNLFASTETATPTGIHTILKFAPNGVGSPFATDLDWPVGLAFDRSGISSDPTAAGLTLPPRLMIRASSRSSFCQLRAHVQRLTQGQASSVGQPTASYKIFTRSKLHPKNSSRRTMKGKNT